MFDMSPMTLDEVQHAYDRPAYVSEASAPDKDSKTAVSDIKAGKNEAAKARSQAIFDTAIGMGVKAGLAWQLTNINHSIERNSRNLDTTYDFWPLMISGRVVPPVLTEAKDLYNQDGDYAVRLSGAMYTIEYQAKFSSVAPNWREYLSFTVPEVKKSLLGALLPKTTEEKDLWVVAVKDGWTQGVEQANLMLNYGLDRLNRDYQGMMRFHQFVIEGKITMPAVASESIALTQEKTSQMVLDEKLLRITTLPRFQTDTKNWKTTISSSPMSDPVLSVPGNSTEAKVNE